VEIVGQANPMDVEATEVAAPVAVTV